MLETDLEEFIAVLRKCMKTIYGHEMDLEECEIWWDIFKNECTIQEFRIALSRHVKDPVGGRYKPKPAHIFEKLSDSLARFAWDKLCYAVSHYGSVHSVVFDDICIHQAVKYMGGWIKVCESLNANDENMRNEFISLYNKARGENKDAMPKILLGSTDIQNRSSKVRPYLIGDHEKAKKNVLGGNVLLISA